MANLSPRIRYLWSWFVRPVSFDLIRRLARGSRLITILLWFVVAVLGTGWLASAVTESENAVLARDKDLLSTYVANVETAKILTQSGQAKTAKDRPVSAGTQFESLETAPALSDYHLAVQAWIKDPSPELPRAFKINISYSNAQDWLRQSLDELAKLKAYGDAARTRGDKDAMRAVAGRLAALSHLLGNLDNQEFTVSAGTALAAARTVCTPGNPIVCVSDIKGSVGTAWHSARGYAVGTVSAPTDWGATWEPITNQLKGIPIPGVVESAQSGVPGPVPSAVNTFWADCNNLHGTNLGTSVKERLPTPAGGYTCNYPLDGLNCWSLLTYAGQLYKGGPAGCPTQGLLPMPSQPQPKPQPTPTPQPSPAPTPTPEPTPAPAPAPAPTLEPTPAPAPTPAPEPQPPSLSGKWSGTYSTSCVSGNWNADVVDNNGVVSGNFSEDKGFIVGPISGTYRDGVANLKVTGAEYSATFEGTISGNSFSGTLSSSCIQYVPGVGIQYYPSSGSFSGSRP